MSHGTHWVLRLLALTIVAGLAIGCGEEPELISHGKRGAPVQAQQEQVDVEPRTPIIPSYPCSSCHRFRLPNPKHRELVSFHTVRNKELHHGDAKAWCYNCHSVENIDRLIISSGQLVTLDQAYELCGSCHGDKLRDWHQDVHGKTRGLWNGKKTRLSCTACHSPHSPKFKSMVPELPPVPPTEIRQ